jgi:RimJ/RimL family protein N-acetyltransferase
VLVGDTAERGKGYCQGMVRALLAIAFNEMNLHRVSLGLYSFNQAALKCYQKAGFTIEGTMRDVKLFEGEYWSLIEMGILEDEWRLLNS